MKKYIQLYLPSLVCQKLCIAYIITGSNQLSLVIDIYTAVPQTEMTKTETLALA